MKLEIHDADEVIAVAFARVALLNISTGIAQESGPIAAEKKRLNIQVMATNARDAFPLFEPAG